MALREEVATSCKPQATSEKIEIQLHEVLSKAGFFKASQWQKLSSPPIHQ